MEYHLKPIGKTCAATGDPLEPGAVCFSVVREVDGELVRDDYSAEGWNGPPTGTVGQWRSVVPFPDSKPKRLDADALMRYFEQLIEDANPAQDKFRYVLALLLLQKRRLKLQGSRFEDGVELLEVVGSSGEGPYEVIDQQLEETEIDQLQTDLNAHLTAEWS